VGSCGVVCLPCDRGGLWWAVWPNAKRHPSRGDTSAASGSLAHEVCHQQHLDNGVLCDAPTVVRLRRLLCVVGDAVALAARLPAVLLGPPQQRALGYAEHDHEEAAREVAHQPSGCTGRFATTSANACAAW